VTVHAQGWQGEWLPCSVNHAARALWLHGGPVADAARVVVRRGAGEAGEAQALAKTLRRWGYRNVTVEVR